jgi:rubrerythrin
MSIKDFSILEAVEVAINMEEEGIQFYTMAMEKVDDPEAKKTFEFLRDEEYKHINTFRGLYSDLAGKEGMKDSDLYLLDPEMQAYFHSYVECTALPCKGAASQAIEKAKSVEEILELGLQIEKDSLLFYQDLKQHSPYPDAAKLLDEIIAEERKHFNAVYERLKAVTGS